NLKLTDPLISPSARQPTEAGDLDFAALKEALGSPNTKPATVAASTSSPEISPATASGSATFRSSLPRSDDLPQCTVKSVTDRWGPATPTIAVSEPGERGAPPACPVIARCSGRRSAACALSGKLPVGAPSPRRCIAPSATVEKPPAEASAFTRISPLTGPLAVSVICPGN